MMNHNKPNDRNNKKKQSISMDKWNNLMFHYKSGKQNISKNNSTNNNSNESNITAVAGNWIAAVGTIISAIGSTPSTIFSQQTLTDFNVIGNILQAGGSAIGVEAEEALLDVVGGQISAIGNLAVVAGILSENEQSGQLLEKQGTLLQVVGVGITINPEGELTLLQTIANTGNIIQFIGNVIQVFADPDTSEGEVLNAVGSWIQALGAVITALATD
ncbi:hypothetical protein H9635_14075 [Solibacillus sp. A46]|uniref:Uncharacterized protein n=2 Tax=Solibacillus faecavium TaxID=2762221 RepID=A0ABR8Y0Z2_9BACL|nr:hypothetical protein [Solibacillus faecavium]